MARWPSGPVGSAGLAGPVGSVGPVAGPVGPVGPVAGPVGPVGPERRFAWLAQRRAWIHGLFLLLKATKTCDRLISLVVCVSWMSESEFPQQIIQTRR